MEYCTRKRKDLHTIMKTNTSFKTLFLGAIIMSLVVLLILPNSDNQIEAKKIKEKKIIKSLVKGLIFKNLSTKKNFLPLPVPIPVPIELNDPPVYIKGKPKYVTVYKPAPIPVYTPPFNPYMLSHYDTSYDTPIMMPYASNYLGYTRSKPTSSSESSNSGVKFNDFDDEFGNYYLRSTPKSNKNRKRSADFSPLNRASSELETWPLPIEEESIDHDDFRGKIRVRRQAYESSYENEPPCYGFPLEINIKSRIKMDQIFPIHGKSQIKKCIKVGRPLLPPLEDHPHY